ncbi:hypothetical protein E1B28_011178 [Marasmius oreades]|uniref:Secreted protein n=1 Tax=Marasmius oreades TaxID=181124 RepID=A0A9P7RU64_9AGAR|nr:uncharacterized protein E1B28_011178 [Marasmius oreades]KAG7089498.1 hypothetical protein E1B28_011178 [Marasmius oreades]
MKFAISVLSIVTGALGQSSLTMNAPTNLVACQPVQIAWIGGTPPYFVSVQDGNNPSGTALQSFPQQNGTALSWTVNVQAGTSLVLQLHDSSGQTSKTAPIAVQPGSSDDCVGRSVSVSGGGTGQPTNTNTQASTTGAGTATNTQTNTGTTPTKTGTGTSATATSSSNAASSNFEFGAAGIVGAALLALLA